MQMIRGELDIPKGASCPFSSPEAKINGLALIKHSTPDVTGRSTFWDDCIGRLSINLDLRKLRSITVNLEAVSI